MQTFKSFGQIPPGEALRRIVTVHAASVYYHLRASKRGASLQRLLRLCYIKKYLTKCMPGATREVTVYAVGLCAKKEASHVAGFHLPAVSVYKMASIHTCSLSSSLTLLITKLRAHHIFILLVQFVALLFAYLRDAYPPI